MSVFLTIVIHGSLKGRCIGNQFCVHVGRFSAEFPSSCYMYKDGMLINSQLMYHATHDNC